MIRSRWVRIGSLLYTWLVLGFVLGTLVLLFPVRWLTSALQSWGAGQRLQNILVMLLVVVYVAVSLRLAVSLNRVIANQRWRRTRWTMVGLATMVALVTAWTWRNPGRLLASVAGGGEIGTVQTKTGALFEFGSYPDSVKLAELKAHGVTAIISLQDPNVVVERETIEREAEVTKSIGLQLIQAPMIPWFSDNAAAVDTLKRIAASEQGHYYVHCGLGRDRVNIAKRVIESVGAKTLTTGDYKQALGFDGRTWDFNNGSLIRLDSTAWLVPYPINEELMGCFIEGRPGRVVVMLDSSKAPQDSLVGAVHRFFTHYGVPFTDVRPDNPAAAAAIVHALSGPVTVLAYRTPWHNARQKGDEAAVAFADAFSPNHGWRIATTTPTVKRKFHQETGGKETGC
jgi:hypothetical protein